MMVGQNTVWRRLEPLALSPLTRDVTADVFVVGAGVAGLSAAYVLAQAGFAPLVIEAEGVGAGMTGRSTAHISVAVDGGWRKMASRLGRAPAAVLAQGYRAGIDDIQALAASMPGACDFAWVDGELVAPAAQRETLCEEHDAARAVGLSVTPLQPALSAEDLCSLRFPRQARLHPLAYVDGIARRLVAQGLGLHHGHVTGFREDDRGVTLLLGPDQRVTATRAVVLAHNLAFEARYPHVRISRRRSYVIAAELPDTKIADTITWDLAHPYHYTRVVYDRGQRLLLVGGADHEAGQPVDPETRFHAVEVWMRRRFPDTGAVRHRWYGDLKQTSDSLALLGPLPGFSKVYVIDGDTGLGFNHAMLGAQIVRDHLLARPNPLAPFFAPTRYSQDGGSGL